MSKIRAQRVALTNALATPITTLNAGGGGYSKQPAPTDYESDAELPVKPPQRKRGKKTCKVGGS